MSTMNNGTTWNDTVTISKQTGTKVTIDTDQKYIEKDIELTINVQAGSAATPNTAITANPTLNVDSSTGVVTANVSATESVSPVISPGFVSAGAAGTVSVSGSKTLELPTQAAQTIVPGTTNQTIAAGKYLTGTQTIAGDVNLVADNIVEGVSIFGVQGTLIGGGETDYSPAILEGTVSTYSNSKTTKLREYAFGYCDTLTNVHLPNCSTAASTAFYSCNNLETVNIGVTDVVSQFKGLEGLKNVILPSCINIESNAFSGCTHLSFVSAEMLSSIKTSIFQNYSQLLSVNFSACTTIGSYAFSGCTALSDINFPVCATINGSAFYGCTSLTSISFPACTAIGIRAFANCVNLTQIELPEIVSFINYGVSSAPFSDCSKLTKVECPKCTTIGNYTFNGLTTLSDISFPVCTTIGGSAFYGCTDLSIIELPACTTIMSYAFRSCTKLVSLYLPGSSYVTLGNSSAFASTPIGGYSTKAGGYGSIYVPASMLETYKTMTNWTYFSSRFDAIPESGGSAN